jgi:tartrate dehydrogenase/decarboxylase / D-malate dehydrogenase
METYRLAVVEGDGIGREVIPEGVAAIRAAGEVTGSFAIETIPYPWSCEFYATHGRMMDDDALDRMRDSDAIFLGAIGFPGVPDHVSLWQMLLPLRQAFDLSVNLRPMRLLPGIPGPLRDRSPAEVDMVVVRENTEGEYCGVGGRIRRGTPDEVVTQTAVFTRKGTERIVRFAFELAMERDRTLISATKSNALNHSMVFWDEVVATVAPEYPSVTVRNIHVDALAALMILHPDRVDTVVASNLFGDILTDLGAALMGSLGLAPSANIDPTRKHPGLFEPIHGSAPDIAGRGIANPMATVWAGSMLLAHLGQADAAGSLMRAVEHVALEGPHTPDLGGRASTHEVGGALVTAIRAGR